MNKNTRSNDSVLRARAIALREAGVSNPKIREELGISGWKLTQLLQGHVEPVHKNLANRAKPELRAQARDLREQGWSYPAIARKLKVSKSSLSLWLRDLPKPEKTYPGPPPGNTSMTQSEWEEYCAWPLADYWRQERLEKERQRDEIKATAVAEVGELSERELILIGAAIYWCEGSKSKPWRTDHRVIFINSDAQLVGLYLRFLDHVGFGVDQLVFTLHIHENADIEAATDYWLDVTGAAREQFLNPAVKKHNPKTVRKKTGDHYHGALKIYARKSSKLYRRIEGWARAIMLGSEEAIADINGTPDPPW